MTSPICKMHETRLVALPENCCLQKFGVLFVGVRIKRALLFGVYYFWKPHNTRSSHAKQGMGCPRGYRFLLRPQTTTLLSALLRPCGAFHKSEVSSEPGKTCIAGTNRLQPKSSRTQLRSNAHTSHSQAHALTNPSRHI